MTEALIDYKEEVDTLMSVLPMLKERWSAMPEEARAQVKADFVTAEGS